MGESRGFPRKSKRERGVRSNYWETRYSDDGDFCHGSVSPATPDIPLISDG